jgi:hypothetical protein
MKKRMANTRVLFVTIRQILINERIICPIIMLAVKRKPKVIGRTDVLKNSIIEINGANQRGVPNGRN